MRKVAEDSLEFHRAYLAVQGMWPNAVLTDGRNKARVSPCGTFVEVLLPADEKHRSKRKKQYQGVAKVDLEDWPRVRLHPWHCFPQGTRPVLHAYTDIRKVRMPLAKFVLRLPPGRASFVKHGCDDPLDCRKSMLLMSTGAGIGGRKCVTWHGRKPTSRYKGVSLMSAGNGRAYWTASCSRVYLGMWPHSPDGEAAAAEAYDDKARELHGADARVNFPRTGEKGI